MTDLEKEINTIFNSLLFPTRYNNKVSTTGFPPYNIIKSSEDSAVIELAVAGFSESELGVVVDGDILKVSGKKEAEDDKDYLHKGIGTRSFERTFTLSKDSKVIDAGYSDGILSIKVEYEIPEEKKPKIIQIGSNKKQLLTE